MIVGARVVAVALVTSLLAGPLAPLASAQQPAPPADTFKEMTKNPGVTPPTSIGEDVTFDETFYEVTAGVMTAFLVPGRAITCLTGGIVSLVVMTVTLGTAYRAATGVLHEGCGGKWIVHAADLRPPADKK